MFSKYVLFSFILNIVSTNLKLENENKQMNTETFDLQEWDSFIF